MNVVATVAHLPDARTPLSAAAATAAFATILDGGIGDDDIAQFLVDLADRGETVTEVAAAAGVLRARALTVDAPVGAIDVCGTGGDGRNTFNVSTAVSIVVAACGVPVAKHGNRGASSRSGASDVLEASGIRTDCEPATAERSIAELGIAFLHAARHHGTMARVAAVRRAIRRRTIFNLLGPLANPASVRRQLVGVYAENWVRPIAEVLRRLGTESAMVVHGDGFDELTVTGTSTVATLRDGHITEAVVHPHDAGLAVHPAGALTGGDAAYNAAALARLLGGESGAYRDIVVLNAAGALIVSGRTDWCSAAAEAAAAIDSGLAATLLRRWKDFA